MDERIADDVGQWVALSERFADEGEMNLSKLLDAAAYDHVRRIGWPHRPIVTRAILRQANYMACHEQAHLPDIEQLRQRFVPSPVS